MAWVARRPVPPAPETASTSVASPDPPPTRLSTSIYPIAVAEGPLHTFSLSRLRTCGAGTDVVTCPTRAPGMAGIGICLWCHCVSTYSGKGAGSSTVGRRSPALVSCRLCRDACGARDLWTSPSPLWAAVRGSARNGRVGDVDDAEVIVAMVVVMQSRLQLELWPGVELHKEHPRFSEWLGT